MTNILIHLFLAATAIEFLFTLWANHRAQNVLDAFIAHPQLYEAAGRPSNTYFVRDIYKLRYRFAHFLQARLACLLRCRLPICAQTRHCHAALGDWARRVNCGAAGVGFVFNTLLGSLKPPHPIFRLPLRPYSANRKYPK